MDDTNYAPPPVDQPPPAYAPVEPVPPPGEYQQQPPPPVEVQPQPAPAPAAAVPPTVVASTPVVVASPITVQWGKFPQQVVCPQCHQTVTTTVQHAPGSTFWKMYCVFCVLGCFTGIMWCISCCLFCIPSFQDTIHICPNCGSKIGCSSA